MVLFQERQNVLGGLLERRLTLNLLAVAPAVTERARAEGKECAQAIAADARHTTPSLTKQRGLAK